MVETKTIPKDAGKRCDQCGKRLDSQRSWFIARHGEYCSKACGEAGASELEIIISQIENKWKGEARNND